MSLSRGKVNELGILGFRKVPFMPNHFTKIQLDRYTNSIQKIESWIEFNLNGRYAITRNAGITDQKKIISVIEVGFEDPKELLLLTLGCPFLNKN